MQSKFDPNVFLSQRPLKFHSPLRENFFDNAQALCTSYKSMVVRLKCIHKTFLVAQILPYTKE